MMLYKTKLILGATQVEYTGNINFLSRLPHENLLFILYDCIPRIASFINISLNNYKSIDSIWHKKNCLFQDSGLNRLRVSIDIYSSAIYLSVIQVKILLVVDAVVT